MRGAERYPEPVVRLLAIDATVEVPPTLIAETLDRDGVVLIRQGSLTKLTELLDPWVAPADHPHQVTTGLTIITPRSSWAGRPNEVGFTQSPLAPHTDRSLDERPPSLVAGLMLSPARAGGVTILADGARVLSDMLRSDGIAAVTRLRLRLADGRPGHRWSRSAMD
ncbi:hypothetical protein GCM10027605_34770 [Micromonospora zhanjiangensis]